MHTSNESASLQQDWAQNERWQGITRPYTAAEVLKLRSKVKISYSLATQGAEKLWRMLQQEASVTALGALTGNQVVQEVAAGLQAIYLSG